MDIFSYIRLNWGDCCEPTCAQTRGLKYAIGADFEKRLVLRPDKCPKLLGKRCDCIVFATEGNLLFIGVIELKSGSLSREQVRKQLESGLVLAGKLVEGYQGEARKTRYEIRPYVALVHEGIKDTDKFALQQNIKLHFQGRKIQLLFDGYKSSFYRLSHGPTRRLRTRRR